MHFSPGAVGWMRKMARMLTLEEDGAVESSMLRHGILVILTTLFVGFPGRSEGRADVERWIREAEVVLSRTESYTAIFHKQERIKGKLRREETILFKFRKPFNIYMKWIDRPYRGRELIYVQGRNENRIRAHEGGILGLFTVNLDPLGATVMRDNRHPITESGLHNLVDLIAEQVRKGIGAGEFESRDLGEEVVYGRKTRKMEGIFPRDEGKGYYCSRTVVNLDMEMKIPIKVLIYDWDDRIVESYGYEDLVLNAGLTDADFDPENPEYRF